MDGILITMKSMEDIEYFKVQLDEKFDIKDLGHTRKILGIDIH